MPAAPSRAIDRITAQYRSPRTETAFASIMFSLPRPQQTSPPYADDVQYHGVDWLAETIVALR